MAKLILRDLATNPNRSQASKFDIYEGIGDPESSVVAKVGDIYIRRDGGRGTTIYFKESGHNTNTGWISNINTYGPLSHFTDVFVASGGETEHTIGFSITEGDPIIVTRNGLTLDEGGAYDYFLDYNNNKVSFNEPLKANTRIKIFKMSGNESSANEIAIIQAKKYAIALAQ